MPISFLIQKQAILSKKQGARKRKFPAFFLIYDRPTDGRTKQPTDGQEVHEVHSEVTFPIIIALQAYNMYRRIFVCK